MIKILPSELSPSPEREGTLLHQSGTVLLKPEENLTAQMIDTIEREAGEALYLLKKEDSLERARLLLSRRSIDRNTLTQGQTFPEILYALDGTVLLQCNHPVSENLLQALEKSGIDKVFCRRGEEELKTSSGKALRTILKKMAKDGAKPRRVAIPIGTLVAGPLPAILPGTAPAQGFSGQTGEESLESAGDVELKALVAAIKGKKFTPLHPSPTPFLITRQGREESFEGRNNSRKIGMIDRILEEAHQQIQVLHGEIKAQQRLLSALPLKKIIEPLLEATRDHQALLLMMSGKETTPSTLAWHSLNTALISIQIGVSSGLDLHQIHTLASGALLADAGMLLLPEVITQSGKPLTPQETAQVRSHPLKGLHILQHCRQLPQDVLVLVYQHHERSDGSGYPEGCREEKIHPLARIIAVADTYSAIIADRPHRLRRSRQKAMEELVMLCAQKKLCSNLAKAFLHVNSLFGVGAYVVLNDGSIARILCANPGNYLKPRIHLLYTALLEPHPDAGEINMPEAPQWTIKDTLPASDLPER